MPIQILTDNTSIVTPGQPIQQAIVKANPQMEYLVAGYEYGWMNYARALEPYIDDLSALLGAEIYDKMLIDACVASCTTTITDAVLNEGHTISAGVEKEADGYAFALEISDAANRMIDNLDTDAEAVYKDMLRALPYGNRVAEKIYTVQGNSLNLTSLKVKPRGVFAFVCDAYLNILGFFGARPGFGGALGYNGFGGYVGSAGFSPLADLAKSTNGIDGLSPLLPRSKFAVLTHSMQDNDPRGHSLLRPAYEAWFFKTQMWPEYLKYLVQFAGPSLAALLEDGGSVGGDFVRDNVTNQPILDAFGNTTTISHATKTFLALQQMRNGAVAVLPGVKSLELIQSQGNGEAFNNAFQMFDQQINVAITGQSLSSTEGAHGATSAGAGVHQDILSKRIMGNKRLLAAHVRRDWLKDWAILNYGNKAIVPRVSFYGPEQQDIAAMQAALAALMTSGYLDPSQYAKLDEEYGLPPRSTESIASAMQQKQLGLQTAQAGLDAAKNPQPPADASSNSNSESKDGGKGKANFFSQLGAVFSRGLSTFDKSGSSDNSGGDVEWITVEGAHIPITQGASHAEKGAQIAQALKEREQSDKPAAAPKTQVRETPEQLQARTARIMGKLPKIHQNLPALRDRIESDLKKDGLDKDRVGAAVTRIMDLTTMRVGSEEYATKSISGKGMLNEHSQDSFGASSLRKSHVEVNGDTVKFSFAGKSRKNWERSVTDADLAKTITQLKTLPGDRLMQHLDGKGVVRSFTETHTRDYMAANNLTPKNLRTYHASRIADESLQKAGTPKDAKDAESHIAQAVKTVSEHLGNTPAIAKQSYINPAILEAHRQKVSDIVKMSSEIQPHDFGKRLLEIEAQVKAGKIDVTPLGDVEDDEAGLSPEARKLAERTQ